MPNNLQDVEVEYVSLVDRAAVRDPQHKSEPRRFLFWKSAGHTTPQGDQMTPEEMQAAVEKAEADAKAVQEKADADVAAAKEAQVKAEAERDDAVAKAAAKKGSDDDEEEASDVGKSDLPPEVVARLEKAEADANARIEKAEKDAAAAQEIAKAEQDRRLTSEFIAKAETFPSLAQSPSEFGVVLKHASESLSKEDYEAIESVLAAANEQITKGALFDSMGRDVGGSRVPSDAYAEVTQKAEALRKADPSLSIGEAEAKVMADDRQLQQRYLSSVR